MVLLSDNELSLHHEEFSHANIGKGVSNSRYGMKKGDEEMI